MESAASMKAAKAGLASDCVASRDPAVAEPAEGAGMRACHSVRRSGTVNGLTPAKSPARRTGSAIERSSRTKISAIDDSPAVRDVGIVVVDDSAAAAPIKSPCCQLCLDYASMASFGDIDYNLCRASGGAAASGSRIALSPRGETL